MRYLLTLCRRRGAGTPLGPPCRRTVSPPWGAAIPAGAQLHARQISGRPSVLARGCHRAGIPLGPPAGGRSVSCSDAEDPLQQGRIIATSVNTSSSLRLAAPARGNSLPLSWCSHVSRIVCGCGWQGHHRSVGGLSFPLNTAGRWHRCSGHIRPPGRRPPWGGGREGRQPPWSGARAGAGGAEARR